MTPAPRNATAPQHIGAAAIRHLSAHGYDRTTAGELADAIGMSRSTFFRRFGSKDDVIFIDHEAAFHTLSAELATPADTPDTPATGITETICRSITGVFDHLTRDPEAAKLRYELLRHTPALRDHELVLTNRYERLYVQYLQHALSTDTPDWVAHALGAGAVSIHNATLRNWLRAPDPRIIATLDNNLRALCQRFTPWLGEPQIDSGTQVLIASYTPGTPPEQILTQLAEHLGTPH